MFKIHRIYCYDNDKYLERILLKVGILLSLPETLCQPCQTYFKLGGGNILFYKIYFYKIYLYFEKRVKYILADILADILAEYSVVLPKYIYL